MNGKNLEIVGIKTDETTGVSTCGACAHFSRSRVDLAQGFGRCSVGEKSSRSGAHPDNGSCSLFETKHTGGRDGQRSGVWFGEISEDQKTEAE
jgi:hypothetical protein